MFDVCDVNLTHWLAQVIPDHPVSLMPPVGAGMYTRDATPPESSNHSSAAGASDKKRWIHLYLLNVIPASPIPRTRQNRLQVSLQYLVTVSDSDPLSCHRTLGTITFAALEHADINVELGPFDYALWQTLGCIPRPAVLLSVPVSPPTPERELPVVTQPPEFNVTGLSRLSGKLMGPDDLPIAGAVLRLSGFDATAVSNESGDFTFGAVPPGLAQRTLLITAKGKEFRQKISSENQPVLVHINPLSVNA